MRFGRKAYLFLLILIVVTTATALPFANAEAIQSRNELLKEADLVVDGDVNRARVIDLYGNGLLVGVSMAAEGG